MRHAAFGRLMLLVALILTLTAPAHAEIYLKTDPMIDGDVTTSGFVDQIEVLSASFGATNPGCAAKSGNTSVSEYFFTTPLSRASVDMMEDLTQSVVATSYTFQFTRTFSGGFVAAYQELKFNDARLTSVSQAGSSTDSPTEAWSISFSSVDVTYTVLDTGGKSLGDETVTIVPAACPGS